MSSINKIFIKLSIITLLCLILLPTISNGVVEPTYNFFVNDYANILSDETENYIIEKNKVLEETFGAQIVVVTVPSLEGNSLEEYSTEVFRKFGIGNKDKNNGLLLLLALEEREFRVEVGYGLEGILPDAKTGRIQDEYIIPYFQNNNWDVGIRSGFDAFYKIISGEDVPLEENNELTEEKLMLIAIFVLMLFLCASIAIRTTGRRGGGGFGGFYGGFYGGSSFHSGGSSFGGSHGGRRFIWRRRKFKTLLII